jgi:hypothetical protein
VPFLNAINLGSMHLVRRDGAVHNACWKMRRLNRFANLKPFSLVLKINTRNTRKLMHYIGGYMLPSSLG